MDPIEEEDLLDEAAPRRARGRGGVTDVTFAVFVPQAPANGETVCLTGTITELQNPVPMQPNQTGERKLWHVTVPINAASIVPPPAQQAPAAMIGLMMAGSVLGGSRGTAAAPTFEYSYQVQNATGATTRSEDGARNGEQGELRQLYYHKANFGAAETTQDEGFKLFVNDEIFQLQSGQITTRDFHRRMVALAASGFTKKRSLLDRAIEDLIEHWGMDNPAPPQVVLAVAAALGTMKRNTQGVSMYGFESFDNDYAFSGGMGGMGSKDKEKEKEDPPSLIVCRWIVKHCPSRAEVEEEQRGERERGRESRSLATTAGVRLAAETLYKEEQTFDWLKLLNFLPEHSLPQPVNASQCSRDEARKLTDSFLRSMTAVFQDFQKSRDEFGLNPPPDAKDRQKAEQDMQQRIELFLRGLCTFCPSVECMKTLVLQLRLGNTGLFGGCD